MAEKLSFLRRDRRTGNISEVRRPRLCKGTRFNSEIVSGGICRENTDDEFRGYPPHTTEPMSGTAVDSICDHGVLAHAVE
jgi:hypothetical protein